MKKTFGGFTLKEYEAAVNAQARRPFMIYTGLEGMKMWEKVIDDAIRESIRTKEKKASSGRGNETFHRG